MSTFVFDQFTDIPHTLVIEPAGIVRAEDLFPRERWSYQLYSGSSLLFSGDDLETPRGVTEDYVALVALHFLTMCPGDTDSTYFVFYTPDQLPWCVEYGPYLSLYLTNEEGNDTADLSEYRIDA